MGQAEPKSKTPEPAVGAGHGDFGAQFSASYRVLWLVAAGITGDGAMAEDVVQEAALVAMGKMDQFQPGTSFSAWMGQMVRFLALNERRKRQKRRTMSVDPASIDQPDVRHASAEQGDLRLGSRGEVPADQNSFDDRLMRALSAVGETARACLMLRTIEGLEYSEIAKLLEIPEGTAMSHVHRSRRLLRERLTDFWPGTDISKPVAGQKGTA